jgi:hypothetical protein
MIIWTLLIVWSLQNQRFGEQAYIRVRVKERQGAPNLVISLKKRVAVTELGLSKAVICEFSEGLGATIKF